jgi:hypothetical protein
MSFPSPNDPEKRAGIKLSGDSDTLVFLFFLLPWGTEELLVIPSGNKPMGLGRIVAVQELEHHHIPGITTAVRLLLDASNVAPRNSNPCRNALK